MATITRLQTISLISLGTIGGALSYYHFNAPNNVNKFDAQNACALNTTPNVSWDRNWDRREPRSGVTSEALPSSIIGEGDGKVKKQGLVLKRNATRHIILIRHGQEQQGKIEREKILTELGRHQADLTGRRLAKLGIKFDILVKSTYTRAQETGNIIAKHLPSDIIVKDCQLIDGGIPTIHDSFVNDWESELNLFRDSARIEAGFRQYFYRAPPEQKEDSFTVLVCHAYVIRFFVCRALQFPPEGLLRFTLNHGSITWVSILPNGHVSVRAVGDTGFMDRQCITK